MRGGFDPHLIAYDQLGPELLRLAVGYETVIADASASGCPALSSRPSPETWSIIEYTGHVEFIYGSVGQMCEIADPNERAPINGVDPDEHVNNAHFNEVAPMDMSARIHRAGEQAHTALAGLDSGAFDWTLLFNGNPAPLGLLTVAMVHESHHHLRDITQLAAH